MSWGRSCPLSVSGLLFIMSTNTPQRISKARNIFMAYREPLVHVLPRLCETKSPSRLFQQKPPRVIIIPLASHVAPTSLSLTPFVIQTLFSHGRCLKAAAIVLASFPYRIFYSYSRTRTLNKILTQTRPLPKG